MAYPNEVQVGRFNAMLYKMFSMEEGSPAPQLTGEIIPAVILENDRPEYKFLGGEHLMTVGAQITSAVSNFAQLQLYNPAGSGALVILEQIEFCLASAGLWGIYVTQTELAGGAPTSLTTFKRDSRFGGATAAGGVANVAITTHTAIVGARLFVARDAANATNARRFEYVLSPGYGLTLTTVNTNIDVGANIQWRERFLEQSESR